MAPRPTAFDNMNTLLCDEDNKSSHYESQAQKISNSNGVVFVLLCVEPTPTQGHHEIRQGHYLWSSTLNFL